MRYLPVIILLFLSFFKINKDGFEILRATSQKWTAGRKEAGQGINYEIQIVTYYNSKILFLNELKIDNLSLGLKIMKGDEFIKEFSKGDTLFLFASLHNTDEYANETNYSRGVLNYKIKDNSLNKEVKFTVLKSERYK